MTPHERFAVEHFLCSYPKAFSYQNVLDALREQASTGQTPVEPDKQVEAWAHILRVISLPKDGHWLAEEIETLREAIETRFPHVTRYADEVANPNAFSHLDTAALYAALFDGVTMEECYPQCFPGYQQEMSLEDAWRGFYHGGALYEKCRANLIKHLREDAEAVREDQPHLLTPNVDFEEIADLCLAYWTDILGEHIEGNDD